MKTYRQILFTNISYSQNQICYLIMDSIFRTTIPLQAKKKFFCTTIKLNEILIELLLENKLIILLLFV